MATDLEWKEKEEEISSEGDGESCGLDTKRRRGAKVSQQTPAMEGENADSIVADATATAREDDRNVYWDADLGSGHSTGGTLRKSTETCHLFSEENLQNGKAVTKLDNIQICGDVENKQHQNHIKKGNELHLHIAPEIIGKVDISVSKPEIQGYEQNNIVKNINATELDLEKIIEEQETHDLFCPNCHSCITKRVILRKRKRRVQDIQHEERPEKLREIEPDDVANSADTGETIHDHGPDVFRCLSCFSFFIPTDNGFNIFRIFGKKEVTVNLQEPSMAHSRLTSDGDANWFFSIFKPESSKNKRNKEASLQAKLNVSSSEDKKLDCNQSTAVLAVSEATQVGENDAPAFIEKINSSSLYARSPSELEVSSGGDRLLKDNQSMPALSISEPAKAGNHEANRSINSGETEQSNSNIVGFMPPAISIVHDDVVKPNVIVVSQNGKTVDVSAPTITVGIPHGDVQINVQDSLSFESRRDNWWEVLKSIVYGGLNESIVSLGIVASAAGAETSTLNIVALGFANLIGGFFLILHDLSELKSSTAEYENDERTSRYRKLLGRRANFSLHAAVAILSYILFGLLPPVIYGFSFRESDDKECKLIVLAAVSLFCIALLAIAKAHVNEPASYIKILLYYLGLGFTASGLSYVAGVMIDRFLDQLGLFKHHVLVPSPPQPSIGIFRLGSALSSSVYE